MVIANPPLAEPVIDPRGVTIKPPFEMGVANLDRAVGQSFFLRYQPDFTDIFVIFGGGKGREAAVFRDVCLWIQPGIHERGCVYPNV